MQTKLLKEFKIRINDCKDNINTNIANITELNHKLSYKSNRLVWQHGLEIYLYANPNLIIYWFYISLQYIYKNYKSKNNIKFYIKFYKLVSDVVSLYWKSYVNLSNYLSDFILISKIVYIGIDDTDIFIKKFLKTLCRSELDNKNIYYLFLYGFLDDYYKDLYIKYNKQKNNFIRSHNISMIIKYKTWSPLRDLWIKLTVLFNKSMKPKIK